MVMSSKPYYFIIKRLMGEGKFLEIQPILSSFIKQHGLMDPKVSKILIHYLCIKEGINSALSFFNKMKENNSPVTLPLSALRALTKTGRVLCAYQLFVTGAKNDDLPDMDVVDYTSMVNGLCKVGHPTKALNLCALAEKKGTNLNIVTYNSVINGLCNQGCLVQAFRLFDSLERINLVPSEITYSILIDCLCKQGHLLDAKKLFERMVILNRYKVNIRIYNSFLNGYCKFGQFDEALKILKNVQLECLDPDEFTISSMINGYCHKGDLEGALRFYVEYKEKGFSPDLLGFLYLMRGLCAKGRMEEARSILREMLESQSVMELINRVNTGVETESIESFLVFLCEQGSIKEAVAVLNEIISMFFPVQKCGPCESQELQKLSELKDVGVFDPRTISSPEMTDSDSVFHEALNVERFDDLWKRHEFDCFHSYYSLIASLCLRGELSSANTLAKVILGSLGGNC